MDGTPALNTLLRTKAKQRPFIFYVVFGNLLITGLL